MRIGGRRLGSLGMHLLNLECECGHEGKIAVSDLAGRYGGEVRHGCVTRSPGRAGRREMQMETRMLRQPCLDLGRLVGGVVVEHDMDVAGLEDCAVDAAQELQEFLGPVARHALADNHTGTGIRSPIHPHLEIHESVAYR